MLGGLATCDDDFPIHKWDRLRPQCKLLLNYCEIHELIQINMICDYCSLIQEKYRVCLTVDGDKLDFDHDATSPAALLIETNLLSDSVILDSGRGARLMALGIKDFFLQTIMEEYEYLKIYSKYFSDKMKLKYNL